MDAVQIFLDEVAKLAQAMTTTQAGARPASPVPPLIGGPMSGTTGSLAPVMPTVPAQGAVSPPAPIIRTPPPTAANVPAMPAARPVTAPSTGLSRPAGASVGMRR